MKTETRYVYVLCRRDLPVNHFAVQAIHAAIAATIAYPPKNFVHPHLVLCAVANENELADEFDRLKEAGVACCAYREDDMGDALTAVATGPIAGKERKHMRKYKLFTGP